MSNYGLILLLSFIIPFIFSFEKKLKFYKRFNLLIKSISIVAFIFLIWDFFSVLNGVWGFDHTRVFSLRIFLLPIEEILFFFIIPYNLIFIYEVVEYYLEDEELDLNPIIFVPIGLVFFLLTAITIEKFYTTSVLIAAGLLSFFLFLDPKRTYQSRNFWLALLISLIPFLIVNYFLTSIPVVWYNDMHNLNLRFITIPIEDFLYSLVLTGSNYLVYNNFRSNAK